MVKKMLHIYRHVNQRFSTLIQRPVKRESRVTE